MEKLRFSSALWPMAASWTSSSCMLALRMVFVVNESLACVAFELAAVTRDSEMRKPAGLTAREDFIMLTRPPFYGDP